MQDGHKQIALHDNDHEIWLQGEVLPIEDRQLFNGVYTVRLDEGLETKVAHCDMQLVLNHAEASKWVQNDPCAFGAVYDVALEPCVAQQQLQVQGEAYFGSGVAALHEAPAIISQGPQDCTPTAYLAVPTGPAELIGIAMEASTMPATFADSMYKPEEEQVVPQLRRTKLSVAQKRMAPSGTATGDDNPGRSVQRKLNHTHSPSPQAASMRETQLPAPKSEVLKAAGQKLQSSELDAWDHDSDDDLYVDLSGSNIKAQPARLQELSTMDVNSMSQPVGRSALADLAGSTPTQANGVVPSSQAHRKAGKGAKLRANSDPFVALGPRPKDFLG